MHRQGVARISISLPPQLLEEFDSTIERLGQDRSKAIQQAMRYFLTEYRWEHEERGVAVGTITLIYDHDVRGLESKLTSLQHQAIGIIASTIHIHLDSSHCLLVIVVRGEVKEIRELASHLLGLRGVKQLKVSSLRRGAAYPSLAYRG